MSAKRTPMDADKFEGIVSAAITDATDFTSGDLAAGRAKALEYFLGKPLGNEEEGQSKVVLTEVRDTIEAMVPSLMRVCFSSEKVVEFLPQGPEDEPMAQQATDYVNYIFRQDNPGFHIAHTWLKDGLLSKVGVVKFWWEAKKDVTATKYTGLSDDEVLLLGAEEGVDVEYLSSYPAEEAGEAPAPTAPLLHDVEIRRTVTRGRVRIEPVPPEEFIISRNARRLEDAQIVGHQREVTISDLVALGYDYDEVLALSGSTDEVVASQEALARRDAATTQRKDEAADPTQRRVLYTEAVIRVDKDGDGIAELRRVCTIGPQHKVLDDEPTDDVPFADWCPVLVPHVYFGLSVADQTMDLQMIKSVIMRQTLNNLVLANNPSMGVQENMVEMDDLLNPELGRIIRFKAPPAQAAQVLGVPFVAGQSLPVLDYVDTVKESRTGLSRTSLGLDPDALQSTTKAAVAAVVSASQGKQEMLVRVFAETGMARLFRGILRLIVKHQDAQRTVRLRNAWVPMDPRYWNADMDCVANVGLGNGDEEKRIQGLGMIAAKQEQILLRLGPKNPLVTVAQYRNTLASMAELAGFRDASRFFLDPAQQPPEEPPAPPPDPKMQEMAAKMQLERMKAEASIQLEHQKAQFEMNLAAQRFTAEQQMRREQFAAELELRKAQIVAEAQLSRDSVALDAHVRANAGTPVEMGGRVG